MKVIDKKLKNNKLNQTDSNYLSRFIRPKLKEIALINAKYLLDKMEYNQKISSIENKIKKVILGSIAKVDSIIIFGSAIQNNYKNYNDIDIMVVTKKKIYERIKHKYQIISEIKKSLSLESIAADIQIYDKETLIKSYPHSPTLVYQLKDHKVIYGKLKLPKKIELYNIDIQMKLDWSDIEDIEPEGIDIYKAIRNVILLRLILSKIIDNAKLKECLNDEIGKNLLEKLRNNKESKAERKIALNYLKELKEKTRQELKGGLWEKIEL